MMRGYFVPIGVFSDVIILSKHSAWKPYPANYWDGIRQFTIARQIAMQPAS